MDPPSCSIPIPRLESIVKKRESICYRHRYYCTYISTRRESRTGMYGIFCGVNKKAVRTFQTFTRWVRFGFLKDLFSFLRSRKGRKGLEMGVLSWFFVTILRTDDWLPLRINIHTIQTHNIEHSCSTSSLYVSVVPIDPYCMFHYFFTDRGVWISNWPRCKLARLQILFSSNLETEKLKYSDTHGLFCLFFFMETTDVSPPADFRIF
jgi:hypothetical protein